MARVKWIFLFAAIVLLSSCSTFLGTYMNPNQPKTEYVINGRVVKTQYVQLTPDWVARHNDTPIYRVGSYDILNIIVWDNPALTTPATQLSTPEESGVLVTPKGDIFFPFAGTFKVAGLSIEQTQDALRRRLKKYIRNPQVTVRIVSFRSQEVQMMGEVGTGASILPITDKPMSILEALNASGGTNYTSANTSKIYVIRGGLHQITIYGLDARTPETMVLAQQFYLRNKDIVYVPPLGIANWNRLLGQLSPTIGVPGVIKSTADTVKSY